MIPISDSIKSRKFPLLNLVMIGVNLYVFWLMVTAPSLDAFIAQWALIPQNVNFYDPTTLLPFVTHMFLHAGFFHLFSNLIFLWVFGDNIESHFGKPWYLIIYFVSGIVGALAQFALTPDSAIPMVGASGAISGILGAYFVSHPHSKIKTLLPIFFVVTIVNIPAIIYIFYWFFLQLVSGVTSLSTITQETGGVAFWAHIGGFLAGVFLAKTMRMEHNDKFIEGEFEEISK